MAKQIVTKAEGEVYRLEADGSKIKLQTGDLVEAGTRIITETGASVRFEDENGIPMELGENSGAILFSDVLIEQGDTLFAMDTEAAEEPAAEEPQDGEEEQPLPSDSESGSDTVSEMHSFVEMTRTEYGGDINLSYARDVNVTREIEGRASLNPRIEYDYNVSIIQEVKSYEDPRFPFDGGGRGGEESRFEPVRPAADTIPMPETTGTAAVTDEDVPVVIDPLENFVIPSGLQLAVTGASAQYGTVQIIDGKIAYQPNADYHGGDKITVTVTDQAGRTYESEVDVTVSPFVDTVDDSDSVAEHASVDTNVLANDKFADLPGAKVTDVTQGQYGEVTINEDGTVKYIPKTDWLAEGETLTDTYQYTVTTAAGNTETATVTITITGTNEEPLLKANATGSVTEDTSGSETASGSLTRDVHFTDVDTNDNSFTTTGIKFGNVDGTVGQEIKGEYGKLVIDESGNYSYSIDKGADNAKVDSLKAGETVTDTFTATVSDGHGGIVEIPIVITVTGTNDAPIASDNSSQENDVKVVIEDDSTANATTGNVITSGTPDSDVDHDAVITVKDIKLSTETSSTSVNADGETVINGKYGSLTIKADGSYTYTLDNSRTETQALAKDQTTTEVFDVTIKDELGATDTSKLTIYIKGTNDAPTSADNYGSVVEDHRTETDQSHETSNGNILDNDSDPDQGAQLFVKAVGGDESNVGTEIDGKYGKITINEDGTYTYKLNNDDPNVQALRVGEEITDEVFHITVKDEYGAAAPNQTLTIKIIGTNDKPEIDCRKENSDSDSADLTESDAGLTESGHLTLTDVDIKDTVSTQLESVDIDHVNSTYKGDLPKDLDLNALQGMLNLSNGTIANDSNTGTINWTFNSGSEAFNFLGEGETLVLKYQIKSTDDSGSDNDSDSHTITVTITGTNDAPKISAISGDVTEDGTTAASGSVMDHVTDADVSDSHTVSYAGDQDMTGDSITLDGTYGKITINKDGTYEYKLNNDADNVQQLAKDQTVTDTFKVTVTDGHDGGTAEQDIVITVHGTNNTPEAHDDTVSVNEGHAVNGSVILGTAESTGTPDEHGLTVTPGGADRDDVDAGESLKIIKFAVDTNGDGKLEEFTVPQGGASETVTIEDVGTIQISSDGKYTFTPKDYWSGKVPTIKYTAQSSGNEGDTVTADLNITVNPVAGDTSWPEMGDVTTTEDNSVSLNLKLPQIDDPDERIGEIYIKDIPAGAKILGADGNVLFTSTGTGSGMKIVITKDGVVDTTLHKGGLSTDGAIQLTEEQYNGLKVLPPDDSSKDFTLELETKSYDKGGACVDVKTDLTVTVTPVTDDVSLSLAAPDHLPENVDSWETSTSTLTMKEDTTVNIKELLKPTFTQPHDDGSEGGKGDYHTTGDGSEVRWVVIKGMPVGGTVAGTKITSAEQEVRVELKGDDTIDDIKVTPPKDYSGEIKLSVTLHAQDTDSDNPKILGDDKSDSQDIIIKVTDVAGDVSIESASTPGIEGYNNLSVKFLENLKVTDTSPDVNGNYEHITGIKILISSLTDDHGTWTLSGTKGAHAGDGDYYQDGDYYVINNVADYKDFTLTPPTTDSGSFSCKLNVGIVVTSQDNTSIVDTSLKVDVVVHPVAEVVGGSVTEVHSPSGTDTTSDGNEDYSQSNTGSNNTGLTMNNSYEYKNAGGSEDNWFSLKQTENGDKFDLRTDWNNPDTDGSEKTYALLKAYIENGFDGSGKEVTSSTAANGSSFRYYEGDPSEIGTAGEDASKWHTVQMFNGGNAEAAKIPMEYLSSVQFMGPNNAYGTFKIEVQAYTVDTNPDDPQDVSTAISGKAELTNVVLHPVPDKTTLVTKSTVVYEDTDNSSTPPDTIEPGGADSKTVVDLYVKVTSSVSDPNEHFNVKIDNIHTGSSLQYGSNELSVVRNADGSYTFTYGGTNESISAGGSKEITINGQSFTVALDNDGSQFSVKINNYDNDAVLKLMPPHNSNVDMNLDVSAESYVEWNGNTYTDASQVQTELPLNVDIIGVPNDRPDITIDNSQTVTEAAAEANGVSLSSVIKTITLTDNDGSETLTLKITGLDERFTLDTSNPHVRLVTGGTGTEREWTVDLANDGDNMKALLDQVFIKVPNNFSGKINFDVVPTTTEDDGLSKTWDPQQAEIQVTPSPESAIKDSAVINEDDRTALNFEIDYKGGDTDETLSAVYIKISDINGSRGFTLHYDNNAGTLSAADSTDITVEGDYLKISGEALKHITAQGDANFSGKAGDSGKDLSFGIRYEITDHYSDNTGIKDSNPVTADTSTLDGNTKEYHFTIAPVTDKAAMSDIKSDNIDVTDPNAKLSGTDADGNQIVSVSGSAEIKVSVAVGAPADQDGSEHLMQLIVDGVPDGVTLKGNDIFEVKYLGDFDTTALGTENGAGQGRWLIIIKDPAAFNGGDSLKVDLTFNVDSGNHNLWGLNGQTLPIHVTAVTQDFNGFTSNGDGTYSFDLSGKEEMTDGAQWELKVDFPEGKYSYSYKAAGMEIDQPSTTLEDTFFNKDASDDTTLWDICKIKFADTTEKATMTDGNGNNVYVNDAGEQKAFASAQAAADAGYNEICQMDAPHEYRFAITFDGLPEGTVVTRGGVEYTVDGSHSYTIEGFGNSEMLANLMKSVTVKLPENYNNNTDGTGLTVTWETSGIGKYYWNGSDWIKNESITKTEDSYDYVTPVTDAVEIDVSSTAVEENQEHGAGSSEITVHLDNSADGNHSEITNGRVYFKVDGDAGGTLKYEGTALSEATADELAKIGITPNAGEKYYYLDLGEGGLTGGDFKSDLKLTYTPAEYVSGSVTLTTYIHSQETGAGSAELAQNSHTIDVAPVNSGVALSTDGAVSGDENTNIVIRDVADGHDVNQIKMDMHDVDGSEHIIAAKISGLPNGYLLVAGEDAEHATYSGMNMGNGTWSIPLNEDGSLPNYIAVVPPSGKYDSFNLKLTVTSGENSLSSTKVDDLDFNFVIKPVADGIDIKTTDAIRVAGSDKVAINLSPTVHDADGSEKIGLTLDHIGDDVKFYIGGQEISVVNAAYGGTTAGETDWGDVKVYKSGSGLNTVYTITGIKVDDIENLCFSRAQKGESQVDVKAWTVEVGDNGKAVTGDSAYSEGKFIFDQGVPALSYEAAAFSATMAFAPISNEAAVMPDSITDYGDSSMYDGIHGSAPLSIGTEGTLDFSAVSGSMLDSIDMTNDTAQSLFNVDPFGVYNITGGSHELTITGTSIDDVTVADASDVPWGAPELSADGSHYTYTATGDFDHNAATPDETVTLNVAREIYDDTLAYDAHTMNDGGLGDDTLTFGHENSVIDFNDGAASQIANIERFDLGDGDHSLANITAKDVFDMTDGRNTLTINGDNADHVSLSDVLNDSSDGMWEASPFHSVENGVSYNVYTGSFEGHTVILKVEEDIIQQLTGISRA